MKTKKKQKSSANELYSRCSQLLFTGNEHGARRFID